MKSPECNARGFFCYTTCGANSTGVDAERFDDCFAALLFVTFVRDALIAVTPDGAGAEAEAIAV